MHKTVIFDLDGTLYFGSNVAEEALKAIDLLRTNNIEWIYLTNNSTKTRQQIADKLNGLGFPSDKNRIYTSAYATVQYLKSLSIEKVFLLGEEGFKDELLQEGILSTDPDQAEVIVVGLDFSINYNKIAQALYAIEDLHLPLIASNTDRNFPYEKKRLKPGSNMILSAILGSLSREIDYKIIGKPSTFFLETITKEFNLDRKKIVVVGDNIESDIEMAKRFNCDSLLVGEQGFTISDAKKIIDK